MGKERPILELRNVRKVYQTLVPVEALKGIDLTIHEGEFVAVIGPSGSGKSTLMHVMGCLLRPTEGDVIIDGVSISDLSENGLAELRGKKLGFVFQQYNLMSRLTALQNVTLPLNFQKVGRKEGEERGKALLDKVGLGDRMDHAPNEMSGGEQQRVAIARALVTDPVIILADEPTGNLDTDTGSGIMEIFQKLNDEGRTLVVVTHEHHIADWAKRTVQIKDGGIIGRNN